MRRTPGTLPSSSTALTATAYASGQRRRPATLRRNATPSKIFSCVFTPKPDSPAIRPSTAARSRSSSDAIPSSLCSVWIRLAPSPGTSRTSKRPGGVASRSCRCNVDTPVSTSSRATSAVAGPIP